MATANDVIDQINYTFPSGVLSDTEALFHLNNAHTRILGTVPLSVETVSYSSLVDGTGEYTLDDTTLRVWSARYVRTSAEGNEKQLIPISVDELDVAKSNWRAEGDAEPDYFYIRGQKIGFYPVPDDTTSGGYPKVDTEVTKYTTLTGASTMPAHAPTYEAWIYDVLFNVGLTRNDSRTPEWGRMREVALQTLLRQSHSRNSRLNPRIVPSLTIGRVTRI